MFEIPSPAHPRQSLQRVLAVLSVAFLAASGLKAEDATQERFEKKYDLAGVRKVRVQNVNGVIQIETGGDQLQVVAVKKVKSPADADLLKEPEIRITVSLRRSASAVDFTFLTATTWSWSPPVSIWITPFTFWTLTLRTPARSYFFSNRSCVASSAFRPDAARKATERTARTRCRLWRGWAGDGISNIRSSLP